MRIVVFAIVLGVVLCAAAQAQNAREHVTMSSLDSGFKGQISGTLYRPAGAGPFPAMVLLHTCAGIQPYVDAWATWFATQGYEALVLDSFGPRGVRNICGGGVPTIHTRALDALGALVYLRSRAEVDGRRIGVIGWSHGAGAAFVADSKATVDDATPSGGGFNAAIGLYVPCNLVRTEITAIGAPLLFLEGSADDWAPAAGCEADINLLQTLGFPASIHLYPGATHAFDNPQDRGEVKVGVHTYTLDYDAGAARDAHDRVLAFLKDQMK
jgi:dienelactone hydrolase